jgi:hypothetical protein
MTGQPIIINTLNLRLEQLDEAQELVDAGKCGRNAATAYIALKGTPDEVTIEGAKALTFRDVRIVEDDSEPETDAAPGVSSDPTSELS